MTLIEILLCGDPVAAFRAGPLDWFRVSGVVGIQLLILLPIAAVLAIRNSFRGLLICLLASFAIGVLGVFFGLHSAAEVLAMLSAPTPKDAAAGGTAVLETAWLAASVAIVIGGLLLATGVRDHRNRKS